MLKRIPPIVPVVLCILLFALLTGCSSRQKAAMGSAPASSVVAVAYVEPDSVLSDCLGWGEGTSGFSLHSASSAVALLDWAEENCISGSNRSRAEEEVRRWYASLSETQQRNFAENWQSIAEDAQTILTDRSSMDGLLKDAGVDTDSLPDYTTGNWEILSATLNGVVPAVEEEIQ